MNTYLLKRFLLMIPTVFGVSLVVWAVLAAAPEPPITSQGPGSAEEGKSATEGGGVSQAVKVFRAQYGLDKPAVLNLYWQLDPADVREAVEVLAGGPEKSTVAVRNKAQEDLIKWGYYAVPALVELTHELEGANRAQAMIWLQRAAQRVAVGAETGRVDPKTMRNNRAIVAENAILDLYQWRPGLTPAEEEARVAAVHRWYDGAAADYPEDAGDATVRAALAAGNVESLGAAAVPALVRLVLVDEGEAGDRAAPSLVRLATLPVPATNDAAAEERRLANAAVETLGWEPTEPPAARLAGRDVVRRWWNGTKSDFDYSGTKWLRVCLLETQFALYWRNLLSLDLGYSTVHKIPVIELVLEKLKYSLTLALSSLVLAYLISVPLGIVSARIHGSWTERAISLVVFALYSLPSFFVATLLVRWVAQGQPGSLGIIPDGKFQDDDSWRMTTWDQVRDVAWHVAAPIFCMTYASLAALSRYAKTGLLNVIRSDYIRTARAKGLSEPVVLLKHAARNGIIPVITLLGTTLPVVVGGSVIIEVIFSIPGFGRLTVESIFARDYNVVIGVQLIVALLTMIGILLSDLLYAVADPRISYS